MGFSRKLGTLAALALVLLTSCSPEQEVEPLKIVNYEAPYFDEPITLIEGCWDENNSLACPVLIQQDGALTHRGQPFEASDVQLLENERAEQGIETLLTIAVHPSAQFNDVVGNLFAMFPEYSPPPDTIIDRFFDWIFQSSSWRERTVIDDFGVLYALIELEQYQATVDQPTPDLFAEFKQRGFVGKADDNALRLWVGHSLGIDTCVIKIQDGETVSSQELYDKAFEHLDWIVQDMGGVDGIMNDPSKLELIVARIQSDASTPWRCIAAATYNIERAGWPKIRFEVMPPEAHATAR